MRVLVTGAAGRVGNVVATGLRESGHTVAVHDLAAAIPGFNGDLVHCGGDYHLDGNTGCYPRIPTLRRGG